MEDRRVGRQQCGGETGEAGSFAPRLMPSELAVVCLLRIVLVWQDPSKALTSLSFVMLLAAAEADWGRRP